MPSNNQLVISRQFLLEVIEKHTAISGQPGKEWDWFFPSQTHNSNTTTPPYVEEGFDSRHGPEKSTNIRFLATRDQQQPPPPPPPCWNPPLDRLLHILVCARETLNKEDTRHDCSFPLDEMENATKGGAG